MGFEITLVLNDAKDPYETGFPFTSAGQAIIIANWAETLDKKRFKSVRDLFIDGFCPDSTDLVAELEAAMKFKPIKDFGCRDVLRNVLKELGAGVPGEQVYVTE